MDYQPALTKTDTAVSNSQGQSSSSPPIANHGSTVPASVAMRGIEQVPSSRWTNGTSPDSKIRIVKVSHMRYRHPDLSVITTFLLDFGMTITKQTNTKIWFTGYGVDQYIYVAEKGEAKFLGGVFEVESREDLERAAKLGNTEIVELTEDPGNGYLVTVLDPEGFPVNFIWGATAREQPTKPPADALLVNDEFQKPRKGAFQRFEPGPAAIHKLGHFGLTIHDFEKVFGWYTKNMNLVPSDLLYVEEGGGKMDVAAFLHVDRGSAYVDHHTFFFAVAKEKHVHHCSFEVHDFDTQNMGHSWLQKKGYESVWGVGRHILGSQIFDYWWDPHHFMVEHYVDGDLVNDQTPCGRGPAGDESLAVWGPDVPSTFLD